MARTRKPKAPKCAVEAYARAVVTYKVVAGKLVKLACQRHLDDLINGKDRGLRWDTDAACHAIEFFGHLRHSTGEWANLPFELQPWQAFVIGSLFGWKRADGLRRFRTAYIEVARKNGKSVLLAGAALYALIADGEPGSHVYAAATTRDQARIVFGEAERVNAKKFARFIAERRGDGPFTHFRKITDAFQKCISDARRCPASRGDTMNHVAGHVQLQHVGRATNNIL